LYDRSWWETQYEPNHSTFIRNFLNFNTNFSALGRYDQKTSQACLFFVVFNLKKAIANLRFISDHLSYIETRGNTNSEGYHNLMLVRMTNLHTLTNDNYYKNLEKDYASVFNKKLLSKIIQISKEFDNNLRTTTLSNSSLHNTVVDLQRWFDQFESIVEEHNEINIINKTIVPLLGVSLLISCIILSIYQ